MPNHYERRPSSLRDVQRALWEYWDPLRVHTPTTTGPEDEYDAYAPSILVLLYRGAGDREIAETLRWIELSRMGLEPRPVADLVPVACQIRSDFEAGLRRAARNARQSDHRKDAKE
jgi:hypothetical protein